MKKKVLGLSLGLLGSLGGLWANPIDLSAPGGMLGFADERGGAADSIEYQPLDAGDGAKLPFRYLFNSRPEQGVMGWNVPLLTSRAIEFDPQSRLGFFEVRLPCGKKLYFQFPVVSLSSSGPNATITSYIRPSTTSEDGQWTAQVTGLPTTPEQGYSFPGVHNFTLTITRWDGWKLYFPPEGSFKTSPRIEARS